jgi:hypothetical protein
MAVFSPTNAKLHFKAYDGNFTDALGNVTIHQHNSVSMSTTQTIFGQKSMYMSDFNQAVSFTPDSIFDVGTGDYTVGMWFYPTQFTSYDRLFVTDPHENASPLRIYNHNGSIQVYVETVDGDNTHDLILSHYLGNAATAENQWVHIMVHRDSGTTKLYINGVEEDSTTDSYTITSSNTIVLGSDTDRGATGVKGYIADFFWTEDAVSFTQADFTPGTAEPITFHSGNPSISSFSSGGVTSVDNVGDIVTFTWSTSGETKLELLKYVGGILSSTEDVLGLISKTVAITQTVSYKLRTTNDNGVVDSSFLNISLGGSEMAIANALSGSEPAQSMQVNVNLLGGVSYDDATGRVDGLTVGAAGSGGRTTTNALSASFGNNGKTIIKALNHLKAVAASAAPAGPTGSIQLKGAAGAFNSVAGLTVNSDGDAHLPAKLNVTGAADMASDLTVDGASVLGATTGVQVSAAGVLTVNNATDASSKTAGAAIIDGGLAVALKAHIGTGLTVDTGGIEVSAGAVAIDDTTDASSKTTGALKVGGGLGVALKGHFGTGLTVDAGGISVTAGNSTFGGGITASSTLGVVGAQVNASTLQAAGITSTSTLSVSDNATFGGGITASSTLGVGGAATFAGQTQVRVPGATNFSQLPIFSIQGTTAAGAVDDFRLMVSGGILRAVAI